MLCIAMGQITSSVPEAEWMYKGSMDEQLCDIEITEERIISELERLRDNKAAGADDLVPRFLNRIKGDISYPLTLLFQRVLEDGEVPDEWREANIVPIQYSRMGTEKRHPITDR